MRIGIIGTGNMADALGGRWAAAGHRVLFGGRSPERARALADRTGQSAGTLRDTAGFGDAVLLALPYDAVAGVLAALGADGERCAAGCSSTAPMPSAPASGSPPARDRAPPVRSPTPPEHGSSRPSTTCPTRCGGGSRPPSPKGRSPCRCAGTTRRPWRVATLVRDLGCVPLPVGGLDRAAYLEATTAFLIGLWHSGHDPRSLLPPFEAVTAPDRG